MGKIFSRPRNEKELQEREAAGLWRAQALAKSIGESKEKITLSVILRIHKIFLEDANPEIAGKFRVIGQDIKKLTCMIPPPGFVVQEEMYKFWRELDSRLSKVPPMLKGKKISKTSLRKRNEKVINLAAWTQYQITRIHPFCEGNGRMARLMTNFILWRYKFLPTDIKYEGENKQKYLKSLCEIDYTGDYRMLVQLIIKGMTASYKRLIKKQKGKF
ncbi:MAG: Fic family protein [Patescibacteria group bacterium]